MEQIKGWTEAGKNLFALLRDALLFALLVLLCGWPTIINERLIDAGLVDVQGPGFHWQKAVKDAKQDTLYAAGAIERSKAENAALLTQVGDLSKANPTLAAQVAPLRTQLEQSQTTLADAKARLVTSIATQQTVLSKATAESTTLTGWMYLGAIDEAKKAWANGHRPTDAAWPVAEGGSAKVVDDAYIRSTGGANVRTSAAVLGVAQVGQTVRIDRIEASGHLKAGGWTVWAHVSVIQ